MFCGVCYSGHGKAGRSDNSAKKISEYFKVCEYTIINIFVAVLLVMYNIIIMLRWTRK